MSQTTSIWLPDHRAVALRQTPASSMLLAATRGQINAEHVFAVTTLYSVTELREILGFEQVVVPEGGVMNIIFWSYLNPSRAFLVASFKYQDRRVKKSILLHDGHHYYQYK